eukprot:CAMPEP_0194493530 /NCGR_PEP_ID=MMETSP0253-20130528/11716_1 /TAXON_ID=2966 /ORGANISM="Noctiluca scintillans" /LENGTH=203 /DNA_ID=CAMNT_0039334529 /DNA_START=81 /DNA_END=692 /DNA_ORIENTATION=+
MDSDVTEQSAQSTQRSRRRSLLCLSKLRGTEEKQHLVPQRSQTWHGGTVAVQSESAAWLRQLSNSSNVKKLSFVTEEEETDDGKHSWSHSTTDCKNIKGMLPKPRSTGDLHRNRAVANHTTGDLSPRFQPVSHSRARAVQAWGATPQTKVDAKNVVWRKPGCSAPVSAQVGTQESADDARGCADVLSRPPHFQLHVPGNGHRF